MQEGVWALPVRLRDPDILTVKDAAGAEAGWMSMDMEKKVNKKSKILKKTAFKTTKL